MIILIQLVMEAPNFKMKYVYRVMKDFDYPKGLIFYRQGAY
jgi:hypothetical protein